MHRLFSILILSLGLASPASSQGWEVSHEDAARWAAETLTRLSLEQKVGQMICAEMRGDYVASDSEQFSYWSRLARESGVGGFVVYGGSPHETVYADAFLRLLRGEIEPTGKLPVRTSVD